MDEQNDLYEHFKFVADPGQSLLRIDVFLLNRMENVSRNKIQQTAKAGNILVNNEVVKPSYKVKPNDVISIVLSHPPREVEIIPQNIPIDIVYEDADIIVINKAANLVVHPGHGNYEGTLLNALAFHFSKNKSSAVENGFGYLVHRIDKNTTGLMMVAKNEMAQTRLARQFYEHSIERKYLALVWGEPAESATIEGNIGRSQKDRKIMQVYTDGSHGKHAVTHYRIIEKLGYVTLVECRLETGRTHQIRAHFQHIGHPLFADPWYGGDRILKGTNFSNYKQFVENNFSLLNRQALHAQTLGFVHPTSEQKLSFTSQLAPDMQEVVERWRKYIRWR